MTTVFLTIGWTVRIDTRITAVIVIATVNLQDSVSKEWGRGENDLTSNIAVPLVESLLKVAVNLSQK
jgi:hypothetical protein